MEACGRLENARWARPKRAAPCTESRGMAKIELGIGRWICGFSCPACAPGVCGHGKTNPAVWSGRKAEIWAVGAALRAHLHCRRADGNTAPRVTITSAYGQIGVVRVLCASARPELLCTGNGRQTRDADGDRHLSVPRGASSSKQQCGRACYPCVVRSGACEV